jgi:hypothetical protein
MKSYEQYPQNIHIVDNFVENSFLGCAVFRLQRTIIIQEFKKPSIKNLKMQRRALRA